jgi:CRP-like cAMP-binding protein
LSTTLAPNDPRQNRLLAALPATEFERLRPCLEACHLAVKQIYRYAHQPITHMYFPLNGMTSELMTMTDGSAVEVGVAGYEGMSGVQALFSSGEAPETLIQLASDGVQVRLDEFQDLAMPGTILHLVAMRYLQAAWVMAAQGAACNQLHPIEERCARWLLMTRDRARADTYAMTHEFLSYMLGTRRATVTVAAGILQRAGLIRYARGSLTILDPDGLEDVSCECYGVMRAAMERVVVD